MYELLSVGIIILLGILGGKLSHRISIPRVTGYMLTGLAVGPSVLGLISSETLAGIHLINDIALGLILFAIGGEIEWHHLKAMGKKVIFVSLAESFGAFILVAVVCFLITADVAVSLFLGAVGIATAPGVTLLVIREYGARGPLTETLLAVVGINNTMCLIVFRLVLAVYSIVMGDSFAAAALSLAKELLLAIVIGGAIAAVIAWWEQKIDDLSELLLVIISGLLVGIGLAKTLGISYLMVCLVIGAVTNNISMMHRLVYAELRQTEMPFYIAFFVLSGASLHLDQLAHLGIIGVGYLIARPVGKYLGVYFAGRKSDMAEAVTKNLGLALLPQAGVAIGMALTLTALHPDIGRIVSTVILSSVIIYEGIGPFLTKWSLSRANEVYLKE